MAVILFALMLIGSLVLGVISADPLRTAVMPREYACTSLKRLPWLVTRMPVTERSFHQEPALTRTEEQAMNTLLQRFECSNEPSVF